MSRALFILSPAVVLASFTVLAGCPASSGGGAGSSSASPAGKESSAKMDERGGRATAEVKGSSAGAAVAAAPWLSKDGGFEIDFRGQTPDESTKDDPNGGTWHDASLKSGRLAQYIDYVNEGAAAGEVMVFLPTREKDKIKRDEPVTFQGLKGRDIETTLASGKVLWIRFLIDGKRVFKLGAVYSGDNSDAKAFIESFKRIGGPASAPSASAAVPSGAAPDSKPPSNASKPAAPAPPKPAKPTGPRTDDSYD